MLCEFYDYHHHFTLVVVWFAAYNPEELLVHIFFFFGFLRIFLNYFILMNFFFVRLLFRFLLFHYTRRCRQLFSNEFSNQLQQIALTVILYSSERTLCLFLSVLWFIIDSFVHSFLLFLRLLYFNLMKCLHTIMFANSLRVYCGDINPWHTSYGFIYISHFILKVRLGERSLLLPILLKLQLLLTGLYMSLTPDFLNKRYALAWMTHFHFIAFRILLTFVHTIPILFLSSHTMNHMIDKQ